MIVIGSENKINSYDSIMVSLLLMSPFPEKLQKPPTPLTKEYLQLPIGSVDYTEEQPNK